MERKENGEGRKVVRVSVSKRENGRKEEEWGKKVGMSVKELPWRKGQSECMKIIDNGTLGCEVERNTKDENENKRMLYKKKKKQSRRRGEREKIK